MSTPPPKLTDDIPRSLTQELITTLVDHPNCRIERIVSHGHASPEGFWYDQKCNEWVVVIKGSARLRIEGEKPIDLAPGAFVNIPARTRHRVESTDPHQPTIWLAVHYT